MTPRTPPHVLTKPTPSSAMSGGLFGIDTVRTVLERLSNAPDDPNSAMSLLLVLRTFALERGPGLVIELSGLDFGMMVTIEDRANDLFVAEMLPISMRSIRALLAEMPEILHAFERAETLESLTLRVPSLGFDLAARMTPVALPSINLLLEAGLLARRADRT